MIFVALGSLLLLVSVMSVSVRLAAMMSGAVILMMLVVRILVSGSVMSVLVLVVVLVMVMDKKNFCGHHGDERGNGVKIWRKLRVNP